MNQDEQNLRLLSIFHYVVAGLAALFACFPIFHLVMGLVIVFAPQTFDSKGGEMLPPLIGWFFVAFAATFIVMGWIFAGCVLAAGRCLAKRKHYMFCLVMAGVECVFFPFGTVLGVFTLIMLTQEPVRQLFNAPTTSAHVT